MPRPPPEPPPSLPSDENKRRRRRHHRRPSLPPRECDEEEGGGGKKEQKEESQEKAAENPTRRSRQRRRRRTPAVDGGGDDAGVRRLAIYVAMAHGGLVLSLALLYGVTRLLDEYWRPIQWALLCSVPLRQLHTALVSFWSLPLRLGLPETLLALPLAVLRSAAGSLLDSHSALLLLLRRLRSSTTTARSDASSASPIGFSKLMQWLVSFALFTLVHERLGLLLTLVSFAAAAVLARAARPSQPPPVASALSAISSARHGPRRRPLTAGLLDRLNTLVGVGLVVAMIFGSVSGFMLFSYKIGIEGKDAVISLKTHLQENNYSERIGLQKWIDEHNLPGTIELCTSRIYETASQYVDSLAAQYNATHLVDGLRRYLIRPPPPGSSSNSTSQVPAEIAARPAISGTLRHLALKIRKREWTVITSELETLFGEFLSVVTREDLVEKAKGFALQSISVSKRVFTSSTMVLAGGASLFFSAAVGVISGAKGLLNFISRLMVFFWLLYYLINTDSGGVMDHLLGMLPISKSTRVRCADVLDHAVSSVLLSTAKVALFQGCLTYLLFRFYRIHFLYMSTFLAWTSAVLPITPTWLSSIPAAAQLAMEARYFEAVALTAVHLVLLDYGTTVIQDEIPGQNSYLTGLSILGGMALFPSALEGAIMGPLLMTVMIAVKNLYAEFVLSSAKEIR